MLIMNKKKVVLFANTDWYLYNFRRSLAVALQQEGYELLLLSPPGPYGQKLRELGLRWEPLPMDRRSLNPLRELILLWHIWRLFRRERPDLVHGFTIKCAVYGSLAARLARVPARVNAVAGMGYVFTNDNFKARLLRPTVRLLLRLVLVGADARLILQNPDDVAMFVNAGLIDSNQVRLIASSGVDCTRFAPKKRTCATGDEGSSIKVVLAARLLWDKGVGEYIAASRMLLATGRQIRFFLAGSPDKGNPNSVPEAAILEWVSEGVVEWLGHVDDMAALLQRVDIMVLPSYYGEGLPRSLIEAAASGLALVTTDMPGCRQAIDAEISGLLILPRDVDGLVNAITRLLDDPELTNRLGAAAREKALAEFDERIVIEKTIAVYYELLGKPAQAQPRNS